MSKCLFCTGGIPQSQIERGEPHNKFCSDACKDCHENREKRLEYARSDKATMEDKIKALSSIGTVRITCGAMGVTGWQLTCYSKSGKHDLRGDELAPLIEQALSF